MRARLNAMTYCWACSYQSLALNDCLTCGAPPWGGAVQRQLESGPGVYVLWSECGMAKIGVSRKDAEARVAAIVTKARRDDAHVWPIAFLPGAGYRVERWLHETFAATRDAEWARNEFLPNETEWFWLSPALRALICGEEFIDALEPEFIGGRRLVA